jgi:hypothetical protein
MCPRAAAVPGGALDLSRRQSAFSQKSPELGKSEQRFFRLLIYVRWTDQNGTLQQSLEQRTLRFRDLQAMLCMSRTNTAKFLMPKSRAK